MRKLMRNIAHKKMEDEGITRINKHSYTGPAEGRTIDPSYFAKHWREVLEKKEEEKPTEEKSEKIMAEV